MTPPTSPPPAIDFAAIRRSCPKAFAALCEWYRPLSESHFVWMDSEGREVFKWTRDLYDFFDQQALFVVIRTQGIALPPVWAYELECEGGGVYQGNYPTRAAAEAAAFTAGFERLEEMLNQKEG